MKRLDAELLCDPALPRRAKVAATAWFLAMLGGISLLWAQQRDIERIERDTRGLEERREIVGRAAGAIAPLSPAHDADARAFMAQARFPLDSVLTALESTTVASVAPTTIDVEAIGGTARVEVEFDSYPALMNYLEQLNEGADELRWVLLSAQDNVETRGRGVLKFTR